jgi:hypothetical protein
MFNSQCSILNSSPQSAEQIIQTHFVLDHHLARL